MRRITLGYFFTSLSIFLNGQLLAEGVEIDNLESGGQKLSSDESIKSEILITASRSGRAITADDLLGSYTIITTSEMERRQVRDLADVLRDVPGMAVSSVAGQTQLRVRGTEANHVLTLVDGIEVSDPFSGEFDLGTLQVEIGSRLEVIRGPQSALYGADAIGGVLAYDSGNFEGFSGRLEGGSNNTLNGALRIGRAYGSGNASLSATFVSTDGEPNAREGVRQIGRDSFSVAGKASLEISESFGLRGSLRLSRTDGDFNNTSFDTSSTNFGLVIDSPNTNFEHSATYALIGARLEVPKNGWSNDLSLQLADIDRDTFDSSGRTSGSRGGRLKASYVSSLSFGVEDNLHQFTLLGDWERERFRNADPFGFAFNGRRSVQNLGFAGEYTLTGQRLDLKAALRHDINEGFADKTTFQGGVGFQISQGARAYFSYGTGIKNPGFFELYGFFDGRFIGNSVLQPEQSESWEIGLSQTINNDLLDLTAVYFDSRLKDEIFTTFPAPDFIASPANRATLSRQKGVEIKATARLSQDLVLDAAYTHVSAKESGIEEVRRPNHIASGALAWTFPKDSGHAILIIRYNGSTEDLAFTNPSFIPVRERLASYVLINFNTEIKLNGRLRLFGRIENLLNDEYEQVFSFVSPGRTALVGLQMQF